MKKWLIPVIILGVLVFITISTISWGIGVNNEIIEKEGVALAQWANVESSYQRRADLIPNLVSTVKGYADHEKSTFESVVEARSKAMSVTINANDLTPEKMAQFQQAQQGLSGALSKLMLLREDYPELKADTSFLELQSQLEGTENRINVERNKFNGLAGAYNIFIAKIPTKYVAGYIGKNGMSLFKAAEGSDVVPKVEF